MDDSNLSTDLLSADALANVIAPNRARLRAADKRYKLDELLSAMLEHAPDPSGKRYVALALHVAHGKGADAVVEAAKAWIDCLFLPMLTISKLKKTEPSSSQTPSIDIKVQHVASAPRSEQGTLREQVAAREQYRCAVTGTVDISYAIKLEKEGRQADIPRGITRYMNVAHIIPFALNNFADKDGSNPETRDAARTWDMFSRWTGVRAEELAGSKINSPANAIYINIEEHHRFGNFLFYFKEAHPTMANKYKVVTTRNSIGLSNGEKSADVEFPAEEESGVKPPNPKFLAVHAASAKVLNACGAAEYYESVERDVEDGVNLHLDRQMDFSFLLASRLAVAAY